MMHNSSSVYSTCICMYGGTSRAGASAECGFLLGPVSTGFWEAHQVREPGERAVWVVSRHAPPSSFGVYPQRNTKKRKEKSFVYMLSADGQKKKRRNRDTAANVSLHPSQPFKPSITTTLRKKRRRGKGQRRRKVVSA